MTHRAGKFSHGAPREGSVYTTRLKNLSKDRIPREASVATQNSNGNVLDEYKKTTARIGTQAHGHGGRDAFVRASRQDD